MRIGRVFARLARLREMHPSHRRRTIPAGFEQLERARQVRLQILLVICRRHAVHSHRSVLARLPVRFPQPCDIHVVRQRRQRRLRLSLSQFRELYCRVEMVLRPGVRAIDPSRSSLTRPEASFRPVLWGGFPDITGTIRGLRPLASRPVSLRYLRSAVPLFARFAPPGTGSPQGLDHLFGGARAAHTVEGTKSPRFPHSPWRPPAFSDIGGPPASSHRDTGDGAFRWIDGVGTAWTSLRGSSPRPATSLCSLRSRGRPRTTQHSVPAGGQPWPVTIRARWAAQKVSFMSERLHAFLFTKLAWRNSP